MRGYFGIGIESASKAGNVGNLIRTGHSFGASFAFAVHPKRFVHDGTLVTKSLSDTSKSDGQIPFYVYDSAEDIVLPRGCRMVAIEMCDDAVDLPSFKHPAQAVYMLGGERKSLSPETLAMCDDVIKIPTKFSLNVATAGAIVMYDRLRTLGGFPDRPLMDGKRPVEKAAHKHGGPISRLEKRKLSE